MSSYQGSQSAERPHSPSGTLQPGRPRSWTWKQLHIFFFPQEGIPRAHLLPRWDATTFPSDSTWLAWLKWRSTPIDFSSPKNHPAVCSCSLKSEICLFNQTCQPWAENCFPSVFTTTRAHKHTTTAVRCVCRRPLFACLHCCTENKWRVMKFTKKHPQKHGMECHYLSPQPLIEEN